jgi:4'-phosphopantetheinyl transferase
VLLSVPQTEGIRRFFWIWTLKEAYTKALGLGLGFDFARIEYDVPNELVRIDGKPVVGWEFVKFTLQVDGGADSGIDRNNTAKGEYLGVAARYLADNTMRPIRIESEEWVRRFTADEFVKNAIEILT